MMRPEDELPETPVDAHARDVKRCSRVLAAHGFPTHAEDIRRTWDELLAAETKVALAAQLDLLEEIRRLREECFTGTKGADQRANEQIQAFDRGLARIGSRLAQSVTFGDGGGGQAARRLAENRGPGLGALPGPTSPAQQERRRWRQR